MKKETKMVYETPWMECTQIEAEGTFAGSVVDDKGKGMEVVAGDQDYQSFDGSSSFNQNSGKYEGENISWE